MSEMNLKLVKKQKSTDVDNCQFPIKMVSTFLSSLITFLVIVLLIVICTIILSKILKLEQTPNSKPPLDPNTSMLCHIIAFKMIEEIRLESLVQNEKIESYV